MKFLRMLVLVAALSGRCLLGAVAFDAGVAGTYAYPVTTLTWSHTITGANSVILAWIQVPTGRTITAATYAGAAMTFGANKVADQDLHCYYKIGPATGANDVSFTMSGAANEMVGGSQSFNGADQTTPFGTFVTASGTSNFEPSITVTSAIGEIVADGMAWHTSNPEITRTVGAGQTERFFSSGGINAKAGVGSTEAGAASVPMTWTLSAISNWQQIGVSVKPVSVSSKSSSMTMGVGP